MTFHTNPSQPLDDEQCLDVLDRVAVMALAPTDIVEGALPRHPLGGTPPPPPDQVSAGARTSDHLVHQ